MISLRVVLMFLAVICFFLAMLDVKPPRINCLGAGLCLWALASMITV